MGSHKLVAWWVFGVAGNITLGCAAPPEGLAETPQGDGPQVVFDLRRQPLPEIPFPNDVATRPDATSPTGLRLNASLVASTRLETVARRRIDELSGFGVYQPIQIRFDGPIDINVIYRRHRDYRASGDGSDYRFDNDAIFLVDVTPDSPAFGEPVPLDFGEGNFPLLLRSPAQYWEHDPKTITKALTLETYDEDWNANGLLEPGEDLDLDGVLDRPNLHAMEDGNPEFDPHLDLVSFYEFETDTLMFRPILPLREKTTYAVVVTQRLRDPEGNAVRSPFGYVNHTSQTETLTRVLPTLDTYGLDEDDIAFAWTFTTQDASGDFVALRNGLYGEGPLSWLAEDNPPALSSLLPLRDPVDIDGNPVANIYTLPSEILRSIIPPIASAAFGDFGVTGVQQLQANHDFYAYHVSGTFKSPQFLDLVESDNLDERAWPADLTAPSLRGEIEYHDVQFWCAIPKPEFKSSPTEPAPVVLYAHGYTSNKIEQLGLALHAKFGIAGCSIDAVLHGLDIGEQEDVVRTFFASQAITPAADALKRGRAEDMDGDGTLDPGGEFFTGYMFKTRDNLRQTLLDWLTLVRLIRSFGETPMIDVDGDGAVEVLGDFDADGIPDIGGPQATFFASGTSLGGLVSSILSAIEPRVVAAAPISGGAGLIDLTIRSEQGGVVEAVGLRLMGPLILGEPTPGGSTRIYQLVPNGNDAERRDLAVRENIEPGDVVMVTNLRSKKSRCARVMPDAPPPGYEAYDGWTGLANCSENDAGNCRECAEGTGGSYACDLARTFRVGVAADPDDPLLIEVYAGPTSVEIEGDERDCHARLDARVRTRVESFEFAVEYRTRVWSAGEPLVALESGFGFQRGTPMLRRFTGIAQMGIEKADPAVYAPHYARDPLLFIEDGVEFAKPPTNVLNVTTIGDPNVPVNTGVAIAKVAGFVELFAPDARYGKTVNRVLIDEGVQRGIPWLETRGPEWGPVLVDVDNLSGSTNTQPMDLTGSNDGMVAPRLDRPLRLTEPTVGAEGDGGISGLVLPLLDEFNGAHGFPPPGIFDGSFDIGQYMEHQIGWFFATFGREVRYHPCLAQLASCDFVPAPPERL